MGVVRALAIVPAALLVLASGSASPEKPLLEGEWIAVPPQSLEIDAGSPLDFSAQTGTGAAGATGPLRLTREGRLAFGGGGAEPRFNCAMLGSGPQQEAAFPTHEQADRLALQLKRHGYTLARLHNVDFILTRDAERPLEIDAEQLDRLQYLLAALKRQGIAWMLDVWTQPTNSLAKGAWGKGLSADNLRVRLHFDPDARATWLAFLDRVYAAPNPYTGIAPLADPALAFVVGANENSIAFAARPDRPFPRGAGPAFDRWARAQGAPRLGAAIPDLDADERSGARPIALPATWDAPGPRGEQFRRFTAEAESGLYRWMATELARRGFEGPLLGYHEWYRGLDNRTRASLPITDIHAYVGEVSSQQPGARFVLPSLTDDRGLGEALTSFGARWLDRPMLASEYGSPFPNPYRYESGLLMPALAAFQGWTALCRTAFLPVEFEMPPPEANTLPMRSYSVGLDPNERAQETLSALLFARGDVAAATTTVAVPFGEAEFRQRGSAFLPGAVKRAALLARMGLIPRDRVATLPRGAALLPVGDVPFTLEDRLVERAYDLFSGAGERRLADLAAGMRARGTLPPGNRTDPVARLFQSQTGQITVDQRRGLITVVTPRTEGASVKEAAQDIALGTVRIRSIDAGGLVAASALDGRPLEASRRVLLIMTGDTTNTGLRLAGTGVERTLVDWGRLPILMRRLSAEVTIRGEAGAATLSVLSLRGTTLRRTPLRAGNGPLQLTLDTAAVPGNPTTYFLLER